MNDLIAELREAGQDDGVSEPIQPDAYAVLCIRAAAALEQRDIPSDALLERTAQLVAHRACIGIEHDPANGKLHGYCVVCGVPWPCDIAKPKPDPVGQEANASRYLKLRNRVSSSTRWPHITQWPIDRSERNLELIPQIFDGDGYHPDRLDAALDMMADVDDPASPKKKRA